MNLVERIKAACLEKRPVIRAESLDNSEPVNVVYVTLLNDRCIFTSAFINEYDACEGAQKELLSTGKDTNRAYYVSAVPVDTDTADFTVIAKYRLDSVQKNVVNVYDRYEGDIRVIALPARIVHT